MAFQTAPQLSCFTCPARPVGLCNPMRSRQELLELEAARRAPRSVPARRAIYRDGDTSQALFNVISGWLYFFSYTPQGKRQILDFALPGEIFGYQTPLTGGVQHGVMTLTETVLCPLPLRTLNQLRTQHPKFDERFIEMDQANRARNLEHLGTLGWLPNRERVKRLLFGLAGRARPGQPLRRGDVVEIPLTQQHLADATGVTAIHVNRTLRELRESGVCRFDRGVLWLGEDVEASAKVPAPEA